jgi:hypothetical protein
MSDTTSNQASISFIIKIKTGTAHVEATGDTMLAAFPTGT